jgi:hypothetical protein
MSSTGITNFAEPNLRLLLEHEDGYDPLLDAIGGARDAMLAAEARMRLLIACGLLRSQAHDSWPGAAPSLNSCAGTLKQTGSRSSSSGLDGRPSATTRSFTLQ